MINLYYWPTPNGWKVTILLEELGVPYTVVPVNIGRGDQFHPDFLAISPNNRIPAIVDDTPGDGEGPISVFESGAILRYLAEKHGRFLPRPLRERVQVDEWLAWQVGGLGPMLGQNHHFRTYAPEVIPYAQDRYLNETRRLYGVLDRRLEGRSFVAGAYSIADMAIFPWIVPYQHQGMDLDQFPQLRRWFDTMKARPAVTRGVDVGKAQRAPMDDEARSHLFGQAGRSAVKPAG